MYVRVGPFTADPTDSHVQARTAPQTRRQKHLGAGFTSTGNDSAGPPAISSRALGMLRHTTGIAGPMHPPSTPDEPSMYFSQTSAPRATPELPAPAQQTSSRTVTATNDRPRAYPLVISSPIFDVFAVYAAGLWLRRGQIIYSGVSAAPEVMSPT
jgi:hypothetical protein